MSHEEGFVRSPPNLPINVSSPRNLSYPPPSCYRVPSSGSIFGLARGLQVLVRFDLELDGLSGWISWPFSIEASEGGDSLLRLRASVDYSQSVGGLSHPQSVSPLCLPPWLGWTGPALWRPMEGPPGPSRFAILFCFAFAVWPTASDRPPGWLGGRASCPLFPPGGALWGFYFYYVINLGEVFKVPSYDRGGPAVSYR